MINNRNFPDFEVKETPKKDVKTQSKIGNLINGFKEFCAKKFGEQSFITRLINRISLEFAGDSSLDELTQLKKNKSRMDQINLILTIILIIILFISFKGSKGLFVKIDQLKNDIDEQGQVIKMEEQNNLFLDKLEEDRSGLTEKLNKVYAAVPSSDEKAEEIISMLEDIGAKNRIVIDSIGIRKLPESQFYYDSLWGVADVYEYTFSVQSGLPNILSFIGSLRSSLRLMDIMTLEIEEGKGVYKANFSLYAYHLIGDKSSDT